MPLGGIHPPRVGDALSSQISDGVRGVTSASGGRVSIFDAHDIDVDLKWHLSGEPFLTAPGKLTECVTQAVSQHTGEAPELSTGGGTSDGRFISPAGVDVVELGPVNASIHKIDEHVRVEDVITLQSMYRRIMELLLF